MFVTASVVLWRTSETPRSLSWTWDIPQHRAAQSQDERKPKHYWFTRKRATCKYPARISNRNSGHRSRIHMIRDPRRPVLAQKMGTPHRAVRAASPHIRSARAVFLS